MSALGRLDIRSCGESRSGRAWRSGSNAARTLAAAPAGRLVTRKAIAASVDAPASVLAQALALLVRARLLVARAGPQGGYRLARPAGEVSIYHIVVAIDAQEHEERCVLRGGACTVTRPCPFHRYLIDAQQRFLETLRRRAWRTWSKTSLRPRPP